MFAFDAVESVPFVSITKLLLPTPLSVMLVIALCPSKKFNVPIMVPEGIFSSIVVLKSYNSGIPTSTISST